MLRFFIAVIELSDFTPVMRCNFVCLRKKQYIRPIKGLVGCSVSGGFC